MKSQKVGILWSNNQIWCYESNKLELIVQVTQGRGLIHRHWHWMSTQGSRLFHVKGRKTGHEWYCVFDWLMFTSLRTVLTLYQSPSSFKSFNYLFPSIISIRTGKKETEAEFLLSFSFFLLTETHRKCWVWTCSVWILLWYNWSGLELILLVLPTQPPTQLRRSSFPENCFVIKTTVSLTCPYTKTE